MSGGGARIWRERVVERQDKNGKGITVEEKVWKEV